ncbi:VanZ family protein [bacterium]|nr:VanZ family protein [bacterium]
MNRETPAAKSGNPFWAALSVWLFYLVLLTLNPFRFSLEPFRHWLSLEAAERLSSLVRYQPYDLILNVLLFLPLGGILNDRLRRRHGSRGRAVLAALALGAAVSLSIEILQLFLGRTTSLLDVFSNSLGTGVGVLLAGSFTLEPPERRSRLVPVLGWLLLCGMVLFACLMPAQLNNALNWDDSFRLKIGDEFTDSRPWNGDIRLAAVYTTALDGNDAGILAGAGEDSAASVLRIERGCLSLYRFFTISDTVSDLGPAGLDLVSRGTAPPARDTLGMAIAPGFSLESTRPAVAFINGVRDTRELSIEVLIRSRDPDQTGPARIVTLSGGKDKRNVTLGQDRNMLQLRVRTPLTGENGSKTALTAGPVPADGDLIHVVAVFNRGVQRLYLNGYPVGRTITGITDYLPPVLGFDSGAARFLFLLGLLFPVPFTWVLIFGRPLAGAAVSLLLFASVQLFYIAVCGQAFDLLFTLAALFAVDAAVLTGVILKTKKQN